ncbi:unnamed protein product, partial [Rotaria magnacalcarata]
NDDDIQNSFDKQEELLRLPCFIHTLQLVVKDGLNESECIRSPLSKVAEIAKLSHKSITIAEKLQNEKFSIPDAIVTRWNSQFLTVSKVVDIPNTLLNDLLNEQKETELLLSTKDLAVLREFISIFTLFAEATTRTQAEQSISISLVGPSILAIYYDLENESRICKHTKPLCHALMTSLLARFGGFLLNLEIPVDDHVKHRNTFNLFSDDIFLVASFLDGQFRLRWIIQSALPLDTKDGLCEKIKNLVALWAFQLIGCNTDNQDGNVTQAEVTTLTVDNVLLCTKDICDGGGLTPKRKSLFSYCEAPQTESKKLRVDAMNEIKEEIMLFLKDPRYETSLIFDKKNHFPYLHRLALRVLCVPATSAPAERIFSKSGLLMTPHRSRLSTDTLSKLTFVKCNVTLIC